MTESKIENFVNQRYKQKIINIGGFNELLSGDTI